MPFALAALAVCLVIYLRWGLRRMGSADMMTHEHGKLAVHFSGYVLVVIAICLALHAYRTIAP